MCDHSYVIICDHHRCYYYCEVCPSQKGETWHNGHNLDKEKISRNNHVVELWNIRWQCELLCLQWQWLKIVLIWQCQWQWQWKILCDNDNDNGRYCVTMTMTMEDTVWQWQWQWEILCDNDNDNDNDNGRYWMCGETGKGDSAAGVSMSTMYGGNVKSSITPWYKARRRPPSPS